jgi:probable selenium-dependent hydroxylase accessory protein YqeC
MLRAESFPNASLATALGLGSREHVAIVGAGGKTTLMQKLSGELGSGERAVITSTTTKVRQEEARHCARGFLLMTTPSPRKKIREALAQYGRIFVGQRLLDNGKVEGIDPLFSDELYRDPHVDFMILEADGAAGRPVKAPEAFEPVIPASATVVLGLMGLDALGEPLGPSVVFRPERFARLTGMAPGQRLTAEGLVPLFLEPAGLFRGSPDTARRIVFLNKADLLTDPGPSGELARSILEPPDSRVERVVIGSLLKDSYSTSVKSP